MKKHLLSLFVSVLIGFPSSALGRDLVSPPVHWSSPFGNEGLIRRHDCYGTGSHRAFAVENFPEEQVTSRLAKFQSTWEVSTKDGYYTDFWLIADDPGASRERVFTASPIIYNQSELILVDVFRDESSITFLVADMCDYLCFKIERKFVDEPQEEDFRLMPAETNSGEWALEEIVFLGKLGGDFHDGQHHKSISLVRLAGLNIIELQRDGSEVLESIDISTGVPLRAGAPLVANQRDPINLSGSWTEEKILSYFGISAGEKLKWRVLNIEGGKQRVFGVLDNVENQQSAAIIKQRILESGL